MFSRPHHQRIAKVLESLDADLLKQHNCLFAGGTAIALRYGEYRESVELHKSILPDSTISDYVKIFNQLDYVADGDMLLGLFSC